MNDAKTVSRRRLALAKETLRSLASGELAAVAGGIPPTGGCTLLETCKCKPQ